ncbi:MAG: DciA family protein [Armatimonadota bacterium]
MNSDDMRVGKLSNVGDVLTAILDRCGLRGRINEQKAINAWESVVGPHIAAATRVEKLVEGVLVISCKSSTWANELSLHRDSIKARLNEAAGSEVVKDIRFSARGYRRTSSGAQRSTALESVEENPLTHEDLEKAQEIASVCRDSGLSVLVERAVLTAKKFRRK